MKEDQTTINQYTTLSRIMTMKTNVLTRDNDMKINDSKYKRLKTIKQSQSKNFDFRVSKSKITHQQTFNFMKTLNLGDKGHKNRDEKFNLDQLGRIEYSKQHSSASRPLNKLKDFKPDQVFCRCCGLPCIYPGVIEPFKLCDNTDKYSILGQAISLYFSFYKFSILILFILLCLLITPSFYMMHLYYTSLSNFCNDNINIINKTNNFIICDIYIKDSDYLENNNKENKESFLSQFNAVNLKAYINLYNNMMNHINNKNSSHSNITFQNNYYGKVINKLVINNSLIYFIVLISLFIINLEYIIFQNNKIIDYNLQLISPSDYTVVMTNMAHLYKSFRRIKFTYMKSNKISSQKEFRRKLGFNGNELYDKNITDAMEFGAYIKNIIINKNEKYNVQLVNFCYKLDKFKILEDEIQYYKNELFKVDNDPRQIKRNRQSNLVGNKRKFFKMPLSSINIINLNTNCCEAKIPILEIMKKKRQKENELNGLLEASKNIRKENFANVAFISFDTISEQEKFLAQYSQNFFTSIFSIIKNYKYYCCYCFLSKKSKYRVEKEKAESCDVAPEPDDIIFENLDTTKCGRIIRTCITTLISFFIIAISFVIVVLLTLAQEKIDNMSFGAKNFSKYAVSLGMTGAISIVNTIFQRILEILTKIERHMSITDQSLSFSIKLTVFTFVNSAIVPLISNALMNTNPFEINYELLVSNMLMMFLVNGFVSPLMWTFNIEFYLKKWEIWGIESKKNPNMRHNKTQKELNELYEYVDIELAYKYSYIEKTLLMTFFYLPLFPLGIIFSMCGLVLGFYLEKFNIGHRYRRPEMMNEAICKFYVNYFGVNFLILTIGDIVFLREIKYYTNYWIYINLVIFILFLFTPYGQYLNFNLIGVSQSEINNKNYNEVYFKHFYNDYELLNPFTRKIGIINYLKKLKNKDYISEEEFQRQKVQIEKLSFIQIMSQAKPSRSNRAKRTLGKKQDLLVNVGLEESDQKAKRLFELIKKLYDRPENVEDNDENTLDENYDKIFRINTPNGKKNLNIPNIIYLAGTIFGTEEQDLNTNIKLFLEESDSDLYQAIKDKTERKKTLRDPTIKVKIPNPTPFIINLDNQNKINNNKISIENNEEQLINTNDKNQITNQNYITNTNLLTKEEDYSTNKILSEIRSEINKGGKNLIRFTYISGDNKDDTNDAKNKEQINDNIIKINSLNNSKELNEINNYENNTISNKDIKNSQNNKQKVPLISNISVTINQFFDRFKKSPKDDIINSERFKIKNDDSNENQQNENILEDKTKKNKYIINQKKIFPSLKKNQEDIKNNERPINNIINIVLKNENSTNNDNDGDK